MDSEKELRNMSYNSSFLSMGMKMVKADVLRDNFIPVSSKERICQLIDDYVTGMRPSTISHEDEDELLNNLFTNKTI